LEKVLCIDPKHILKGGDNETTSAVLGVLFMLISGIGFAGNEDPLACICVNVGNAADYADAAFLCVE
jgi:hypothetical protein